MERQARHTQTAESLLTAFPAFNSYATRMMLWPIEAWLHLQSEMLNAATPATAEWLDRRREGTTAALETIEKLAKCKDAQDASKVQSDWVKDETKRLEADMRAFGDQALLFTRAAEKVSQQQAQATARSAA